MSIGGPPPSDDDIPAPGVCEPRDGVAERWIRLAAARVAERRTWLTELDAAIGDGDHGINLDRGLRAVVARLDAGELHGASTAEIVGTVGRWITGTVGGASGALYGQALVRAGAALEAAPASASRLERASLALAAAVEGIVALGRARTGEKTMVDALVPAAEALASAAAAGRDLRGGLDATSAAADVGAAATVPLLATKGRASYLGARSVGHLDPGAASSALLLAALADAVGTERHEAAVP